MTDDGLYVRYSGFSRAARSNFSLHPVGTVTAAVASLEEEKELFDVINFGGVEQGDSDLLPAPAADSGV
jgi:hypothetical protein